FDDAVGPALRHQAVLNQLELGIVDSIRAEPTRYPQGVRMLALARGSGSTLPGAGHRWRTAA
ncbi:MAG: hypothetical protein ACOYO7_09730, partial [Phycisphaerales bacterium]